MLCLNFFNIDTNTTFKFFDTNKFMDEIRCLKKSRRNHKISSMIRWRKNDNEQSKFVFYFYKSAHFSRLCLWVYFYKYTTIIIKKKHICSKASENIKPKYKGYRCLYRKMYMKFTSPINFLIIKTLPGRISVILLCLNIFYLDWNFNF